MLRCWASCGASWSRCASSVTLCALWAGLAAKGPSAWPLSGCALSLNVQKPAAEATPASCTAACQCAVGVVRLPFWRHTVLLRYMRG